MSVGKHYTIFTESKLQRFIVCKMIFAKNLQFYKKYITLDNSSSHYDRHTFMSDTEIIVVFFSSICKFKHDYKKQRVTEMKDKRNSEEIG